MFYIYKGLKPFSVCLHWKFCIAIKTSIKNGSFQKKLVALLFLIMMLMKIFCCWITSGYSPPEKGDGLHSPLTNWWCIFIEMQEVKTIQSWQVCLNKIILWGERWKEWQTFCKKIQSFVGFFWWFSVLHKTYWSRSGYMSGRMEFPRMMPLNGYLSSWGLNVFDAQQ